MAVLLINSVNFRSKLIHEIDFRKDFDSGLFDTEPVTGPGDGRGPPNEGSILQSSIAAEILYVLILLLKFLDEFTPKNIYKFIMDIINLNFEVFRSHTY
jgi:hypothetical protein